MKFCEILDKDCAMAIIAILNIIVIIGLAIFAHFFKIKLLKQAIRNEKRKSIREIRMEIINSLNNKTEQFIGMRNFEKLSVRDKRNNILKVDIVIAGFITINKDFFDNEIIRFKSQFISNLHNDIEKGSELYMNKIDDIFAGVQIDIETYINKLYKFTNKNIK